MQEPWSVSLLKWGAVAVAGGLIGGLGTLFRDEIHAYVSYWFVTGNLFGNYVLDTFEYNEKEDKWKPARTRLSLMHGGTKVFGTETGTSNTWRHFGYFRDPVLALAYENNDTAALGSGTYTLTRDVPYVLWGHWIGVECNANTHKRFLAQCPAVLFRADHAETRAQYDKFMNRDCIPITLDVGPCPVRKDVTTKKPDR
jgi:hypothetical protein